MPSTPEFDQTVRATDEWLDDLVSRLDWHDRHRAYRALTTTLHALRHALPQEEAIDLGGPLPTMLRGLYYEGWHPHRVAAARTRSAFLERIQDGVHLDPGVDPEQVARAVLAVLASRLPTVDIEEAKAATPHALHGLWPS